MIAALLRSARAGQRRAVLLGMAAAAAAALSAIGLLAVSGWFLTGAAIAGLTGAAAVKAFNYLVPSAAIRGLAILRTLSRYGERLFSHQAMLFALAEVRAVLFARLIAAPPATALLHNRGDVAARLGGDVETLEEALLRTTLVPSGIATLAGTMLLMARAGWAAAAALLGAAGASFAVARRIGRDRIAPALDAESAALGALKRCYVELAAGGDYPDYHMDLGRKWEIDPLLTYRLNPFSVFYLGSTHDLRDFNAADPQAPSLFRQTGRQYFMKLQYLWQI